MKKLYTAPEMLIEEIDFKDILTSSTSSIPPETSAREGNASGAPGSGTASDIFW